MKFVFDHTVAQFGEEYDLSHLSPEEIKKCDKRLFLITAGSLCLHPLTGFRAIHKTHIVARVCYCGQIHHDCGWTVVRWDNTYKVYKRDCPADSTHFASDLAPFTHATYEEAHDAGMKGNYAYKRRVYCIEREYAPLLTLEQMVTDGEAWDPIADSTCDVVEGAPWFPLCDTN